MNTKELRIGNYVKITNDPLFTDKLFEVKEIYTLDVKLKLGHTTIRRSDDKIEPIQMTKEWCNKFGHEYEYETASVLTDALNDCQFSESYMGCEVRSNQILDMKVHELQNLYFVLTGKELTIK